VYWESHSLEGWKGLLDDLFHRIPLGFAVFLFLS